MLKMPFHKLIVWQKSLQLVKLIDTCTSKFPKREQYVLTDQMRRAVLSISSNIAEGSQRGTQKDFAYFLLIAKGSTTELLSQIFVAYELGYINEAELTTYVTSTETVDKMLRSLHLKVISNS